MRPVCDTLKANVPEIMREWEGITHEEPWTSLPKTYRVDALPDVAIGLFEASLCDPADPAAQRMKVEAALEHGARRRVHDFPDAVLLTEYYLLREAIWRYMVRTFDDQVANDAILRIDSAIMLATRATLIGYHRAEYESQGRWDNVVDRLVEDAPLFKLAQADETVEPSEAV